MAIIPLPKNYRGRYPSTAIASYDQKDIATGTGYRDYYLVAHGYDTGFNDYFLIDSIEFSNAITKITTAAADDDHDLTPFAIPQDIAAGSVAYIVCNGFSSAAGIALTFQLRKVSNGVETNMSGVITSDNMDTDGKVCLTAIPITTSAHFGVGDILRLNIGNDIAGGETITFGIDPMNRNDPTVTPKLDDLTMFRLRVPYRI